MSLVGYAALAASLAQLGWASEAEAQATFVGPVPYLSTADIPSGFYQGGLPTALDDFEDCSLDFGMTASVGGPIAAVAGGGCTSVGPIVDSVDIDDGVIDGSGSLGRSWFNGGGSVGITFSFPFPVTAAGGVWTDGAGTTSFEAFGPGMVSLGTIGPVTINDGLFTGETGEDHFFGVQDPGGIVAIKLSNSTGGIEVDHIQYGEIPVAVPALAPAGWVALTFSIVATGWIARRRITRR
jgi:hypothetical protein